MGRKLTCIEEAPASKPPAMCTSMAGTRSDAAPVRSAAPVHARFPQSIGRRALAEGARAAGGLLGSPADRGPVPERLWITGSASPGQAPSLWPVLVPVDCGRHAATFLAPRRSTRRSLGVCQPKAGFVVARPPLMESSLKLDC